MGIDNNIHAYSEDYLESVISVHSLLFEKFEEVSEYNTFSMIDTYMQYSEIRSLIDIGNWSALNKGSKQLFNSVDFNMCKQNNLDIIIDTIVLKWMATMYVLLQWKYNLKSSLISLNLPAEELYRTYNPLHETSFDIACEKLFNKYLYDLR
jgi:hypothetical protein